MPNSSPSSHIANSNDSAPLALSLIVILSFSLFFTLARFSPPPFFYYPFLSINTQPTQTQTQQTNNNMPCLKRDLSSLLATARPFLRDELETVDPKLPSLIATLRSVGAGECWHKHGTFLAHLVEVYRILKLWGAPDAVALCGLYHSAYSNSYVNLAIFDPSASRDKVRALIGPAAEHLVNLFCIVNRQTLIHDHLLFKYSDEELVEHLAMSKVSVDENEPWRVKLRSLVPAEGIIVKHIRTGEDVAMSRRVVACFLMMTMADFSDQLFGFQDQLFENDDGKLEFKGNRAMTTLWPGNGKPGMYLNSVSRMGALYMLMAREEEIMRSSDKEGEEEIELVIPPVFEGCTKVLDSKEQKEARDLYWEAVYGGGEKGLERVEEMLLKCSEKNPFVGEPHLVLGQVYLGMGRYEEGEEEVERGLKLMLEWGSGWDKRVSWEGWVAWGRVMLMKAKEKDWPHTAWGILNLGLVK